MKTSPRSLWAAWALLGLACSGPTSLLQTADIPPSEACPAGGVEFQSGIDDDGDGSLSEEEIDSTAVVCNGVDGEDGEPGQDGAQGEPGQDGAQGPPGEDGDDGAPGEAGEDGQGAEQPLISLEALDPGEACPAGGVAIHSGLDDDGDGDLDAEEIDDTKIVCNGEDGEGSGGGVPEIHGDYVINNSVDLELILGTTAIDGSLTVSPTSGVTELSLPRLETVGDLIVQSVPGLTTLSLPKLGEAASVSLVTLPALGALDLSALATIHGDAHFSSLGDTAAGEPFPLDLSRLVVDNKSAVLGLSYAAFTEVDLGSIRSVKDLLIHNNPWLTSISGLDDLTAASGTLSFERCPSLGVVPGLDRLEEAREIRLAELPLVTELPGLPALEAVVTLRLSNLEVASGGLDLGALASVSTLQLTDLPELQALPAFDRLTSLDHLDLNQLDALESVDGFHGLTAAQSVSIDSLSALKTLQMMEEVTTLGALFIASAPSLERVDCFQDLTEATVFLAFYALPLVDTFDFPKLKTVGDLSLNAVNVRDLADFSGLTSLTRSSESSGSLSLEHMPSLESLAGLEGLTSIPGLLTAERNPALTDLDGLQNVTSFGSLSITENPLLPTCEADALRGLTSGAVYISGNGDGSCQ